jgi:hypothetical protein
MLSVLAFAPSAPAAPAKAAASPPFIDQGTVFYSCFLGVAAGTITVALPPMQRWALYNGAIHGMASIGLRAGLGCWFGIMGGVVVSGTQSTLRMVRESWDKLFTSEPSAAPVTPPRMPAPPAQAMIESQRL